MGHHPEVLQELMENRLPLASQVPVSLALTSGRWAGLKAVKINKDQRDARTSGPDSDLSLHLGKATILSRTGVTELA